MKRLAMLVYLKDEDGTVEVQISEVLSEEALLAVVAAVLHSASVAGVSTAAAVDEALRFRTMRTLKIPTPVVYEGGGE